MSEDKMIYTDVDCNIVAVHYSNGKFHGNKDKAVHCYFEAADGHKTPFLPWEPHTKSNPYEATLERITDSPLTSLLWDQVKYERKFIVSGVQSSGSLEPKGQV